MKYINTVILMECIRSSIIYIKNINGKTRVEGGMYNNGQVVSKYYKLNTMHVTYDNMAAKTVVGFYQPDAA